MNVDAAFVSDCMTQVKRIRIQCMSFQVLYKCLSLDRCLGGLFLSALNLGFCIRSLDGSVKATYNFNICNFFQDSKVKDESKAHESA